MPTLYVERKGRFFQSRKEQGEPGERGINPFYTDREEPISLYYYNVRVCYSLSVGGHPLNLFSFFILSQHWRNSFPALFFYLVTSSHSFNIRKFPEFSVNLLLGLLILAVTFHFLLFHSPLPSRDHLYRNSLRGSLRFFIVYFRMIPNSYSAIKKRDTLGALANCFIKVLGYHPPSVRKECSQNLMHIIPEKQVMDFKGSLGLE